MTIINRKYTKETGYTEDFHKVRNFLKRINKDRMTNHHFMWGRWEWAFALELDADNLGRIGIWEDDGVIVALATYEDKIGNSYICLDPDYNHLKEEILEYIIDNLMDEGINRVLIDNNDREFGQIARKRGLVPTNWFEENAVIDIDDNLNYTLPEGYKIISFEDEYDVLKHHACLWYGFNHEGEPPVMDEDLVSRKRQVSAPHMDKSLLMMVVAPNGDYVSYCGMWYDPEEDYALVEPVATHPDYRKKGLGKAAVLEGVKRCGLKGAKVAYVGSKQQFYYNIGFNPVSTGTMWSYNK